MEINRKYFVCNKSLIHYPKGMDQNTFINSVSWSDYSYYISFSGPTYGTRSYYQPPQYNYWEFSLGNIYQQIGVTCDGGIYLVDNHGRSLNIIEEGVQEYFTELVVELDDRTKECIKNLEKKGFEITFEPMNCTIDEDTKKVTLTTYVVRLKNNVLFPKSWFNTSSVIATDIYNGLFSAMRDFKHFSICRNSMQNALKGSYLTYANKRYQEKLKREKEEEIAIVRNRQDERI